MSFSSLTNFFLLLIIISFGFSCKNKNTYQINDKKNEINRVLNTTGEKYKKNKDYRNAFEKFNNGDYKNAYIDFVKLIKKYPNDLELNYHIGLIAAKSNNILVAKKFLLKTISIDKKKWEAYRELAALYKSQYKYRESLRWVKKVFKYEKNDPLSNFIMAYLSNKLEKNNKAYIYYDRAIKGTSTYMLAYIHYGEFYFSRKQYRKAEKVWTEGLKKRYSTTIAKRLARLYTITKEYNKSISLYNEILKLYPKNSEPYFYIGKIYEKKGNDKMAIKYYYKSLAINKNYDSPKIALADIFTKNREYKKAINIYKELNEEMISRTTLYLYKQGVLLKKIKNRKDYNNIIMELKKNPLKQSKDYLKLLTND